MQGFGISLRQKESALFFFGNSAEREFNSNFKTRNGDKYRVTGNPILSIFQDVRNNKMQTNFSLLK